MTPAKSLKIFSFLIIFFGLAGFSLPATADTSYRFRCNPSSPYIFVDLPSKSASAACAAVYGVGAYSVIGDNEGAFCGEDSSSSVGNCNFWGVYSLPPEYLEPDHPFCLENPDNPVCLNPDEPDPDPEPDPFAPDSPYCIERPYDPICTGDQEPTQNECAFGVGADSCCASLAAQRCGAIENVLSWDLNSSLDTCTYSCSDGQLPPPETPEPPEFDNTPPDIVDPTAPATPEAPSDPDNPVSTDIANNTQSINDLNRLIAESTNITNSTIANADRNNQAGLQGVIDAVNAAGANNYIGQGTLLADNFGDGTLSPGDKAAIREGLGITSGDEGWGSLESTIDISDYSDNYDYVITSTGCPAPYQMQLFGSNFELSYQPVCDIFEYMGYLVILAGVFLTPYIVFGFRGK